MKSSNRVTPILLLAAIAALAPPVTADPRLAAGSASRSRIVEK